MTATQGDERISTGVAGLDTILGGGIPKGRLLLVEGEPGTGKTTLALQCLAEARDNGARALFVSVAQSLEELDVIAASHGIDLDGIEVFSPRLEEGRFGDSPSLETEPMQLERLMRETLAKVDEVQPEVFVFDSLLELRLLATRELSYRRESLLFRQGLRDRGVTAILLDHIEPLVGERHAEGIAHGVIRLERRVPDLGMSHRRLHILKMRGSDFATGYHDFRIARGGLQVFPRVIPSRAVLRGPQEVISTGDETLTQMLGGGLETGTTALISGQSGTGKSTMIAMFTKNAAEQGKKAAVFLFEERPEVFRERSASLGLSLEPHLESGKVEVTYFDPAEISPGEFARAVIDSVEVEGVRVVAIDSITGYINALPDHSNTLTHLHALLQYLARSNVLVLVAAAQHGLLGEEPRTDLDTSYLADAVLLLRHYAAGSEVRRSFAVLKKRQSDHARVVAEFVISPDKVGVTPLDMETALKAEHQATIGAD